MFNKVLIANRGEIACRIVRTAKRLGMATVAVYSDADRDALHVSLADEAFRIGPPPAAESYLRIDRIVEAALRSGAEAVHPGYGFLSENPGFADAVAAAGLIFVGPPPAAMRAMALKDAAKALMEKSGVPVVPGYHGDSQDPARLAEAARKVGYPVLIKARAGGGGKGMRRVDRAEDFQAALEGAQREAFAGFGDGHCLIERYVTRPRHIEMQVFGDTHGNVIHLFERDCSLQRRHQKVIEEAPAPGMTPELRATLGDIAVRAARAIGYVGAGTVEFVADVSDGLRADRIYFMEMNTRLQVEHPVTEAITGHDLVEWQFRVAAGEPLPLRQQDVSIDGWSFEARLYAEDPTHDFLPAPGTLHRLSLPTDNVRIDSGVRQGDTISSFYDPMIAKLIVHGSSRAAALNRLAHALQRSIVLGTTTNVDFLLALCRHQSFAAGDVDTGLIARDIEGLITRMEPAPHVRAVAAIAALDIARTPGATDPWSTLSGWRQWTSTWHAVHLNQGAHTTDARVTVRSPDTFRVELDGEVLDVALLHADAGTLRCDVSGRIITAHVLRQGNSLSIKCDGPTFIFTQPDRSIDDEQSGDDEGDSLFSPMPGLVKAVMAKAGSRVSRGDPLVVVEAMKMEYTLTAPRDGDIADVFVSSGDNVQSGALLLALATV